MQTGNLSVTVVDAQEQERAAFGGDVVKPQVSFRAGVSLAENWAAFAKGSGRFPQGGDGAAAAALPPGLRPLRGQPGRGGFW